MKKNILITTVFYCCCVLFASGQQIKLSSYPTADATIYLDFDGEEILTPMWNNGEPLHCIPAGLTNQQIAEVHSRVAEDFRPFSINVTTDKDVYAAAPFDKRMTVIITPTSSWFANVGGVSYLNSFTWGDDTPCFVFCDRLGPNSPKMVAECCSHESGHTLGLSHQSRYDEGCHLAATYHDGEGNGETSWAPIMGNSYYRNMSGWSNGPTPYGCGTLQDNLSILTTQNGFGYRDDDHSDNIAQLPTKLNFANNNNAGIINTSADKDAFAFSLQHKSVFQLEALPFNTGGRNDGANLDIKLTLFNSEKNIVQVYNPAGSMSVSIDTVLGAGDYYLLVEGTGNMNTTGYGSLGSYTLKGLHTVLPICTITLNGAAKNNMHHLNWQINCNELIQNVTLQSSINAISFNDISDVTSCTAYNSVPFQNTDLYYRLQVHTLSGATFYSSATLLKKTSGGQPFIVPTFVRGNISITAPEGYAWQLLDINGNSLMAGNGTAGYNTINTLDKPSGIYILLLTGYGYTKTIKVLKQ